MSQQREGLIDAAWFEIERRIAAEKALFEARAALAEVPKAAGPNFEANNPWMVRHAAALKAAREAKP